MSIDRYNLAHPGACDKVLVPQVDFTRNAGARRLCPSHPIMPRCRGILFASNPKSEIRSPKFLRRGFNLLEVLISMAVFAIGFVAVASIFPAAAFLQKQTTDEYWNGVCQDAITNLIQTSPLSATSLTGAGYGANTDIAALSRSGYSLGANFWTLPDRSFPSSSRLDDVSNGNFYRKYYWVPVIRTAKANSTQGSDWTVYVFVMTRGTNEVYTVIPTSATWVYGANRDSNSIPSVASMSVTFSGSTITVPGNQNKLSNGNLMLRAGDLFLNSDGNIYNVKSAAADGSTLSVEGTVSGNSPTTIYFAPPASSGGASPTLAIFPVSNGVK